MRQEFVVNFRRDGGHHPRAKVQVTSSLSLLDGSLDGDKTKSGKGVVGIIRDSFRSQDGIRFGDLLGKSVRFRLLSF